MPRTLTIHLSGPAEEFVDRMMKDQHLSDRDVIAKALGLLQIAVDSRRVGVVKPMYAGSTEHVEYYFASELGQSSQKPDNPGAPISARD
jgi:hypothetical protein